MFLRRMKKSMAHFIFTCSALITLTELVNISSITSWKCHGVTEEQTTKEILKVLFWVYFFLSRHLEFGDNEPGPPCSFGII